MRVAHGLEALFLASALVLTGACGDDDDASDDTSGAPTTATATGTGGGGGGTAGGRAATILGLSGDPASGEMTFMDPGLGCANDSCHGSDGMGTNSLAMLSSLSDDDLVDVLLNGRPGTAMTAFGGRLDDQQIADVIAYLRQTFG